MEGLTDEAGLRERRRRQARFAGVFLGVAAALFALYAFPYAPGSPVDRFFRAYLRGYAHLAGALLGLFDGAVAVHGNVISGRFSMSIVRTCDAMEANVLFLAAIVAFPAPWSRKAVAAALGLLLLVGANLARICSLYFVGVHAPSAFEALHIEVWPLVLIVLTVANFLLWVSWMTRPSAPATTGLATA